MSAAWQTIERAIPGEQSPSDASQLHAIFRTGIFIAGAWPSYGPTQPWTATAPGIGEIAHAFGHHELDYGAWVFSARTNPLQKRGCPERGGPAEKTPPVNGVV